MGTIWGRSSSLEWDDNGVLAEGALAYFYSAGTSTPLTVYQDGGESTAHEDPVEADGARWPAVFVPYGTYKFIIKTATGTTLFSADNIPNEAPNDTAVTVDADSIFQTGDIIHAGKNGTRTGFVRCNGGSIGNASSSATQRANADTEDLFLYLWNNYLDASVAVSGGRGGSAAADYAANKRIQTPDYRGYCLAGFSDMGGVSDNGAFINAPVTNGSGILAGSRVGEYTHALITAELASHTHTFSATTGAGSAHSHSVSGNTGAEAAHTHTGTTGTESAGHTHTYNTATTKTGTATGFGTLTGSIWAGADTSATSSGVSATHTHSFTSAGGSSHLHSISLTSDTEAAHTHSVSGTSGSNGSGTAHNIIQLTAPVTILMKL
jgi:hypothetical protein